MKYLIAVLAVTVLTGCGHHMRMHRVGGMGMHSGGGMHAPASGAYGPAHAERDDAFHSWVN